MARQLTYYDYFGLAPNAEPAELRAAYLEAVRRYHPDLARNEDDRRRRETMARLLNEAWQVLRDPETRAAYDARLAARRRRGWRLGLDLGLARLARPRADWILRHATESRELRSVSALAAAAKEILLETRIGQWIIVIATGLVLQLMSSGTSLSGSLPIVGLLAVSALLARGGTPTPAHDAVAILVAIGTAFNQAVAHALGSAARRVATPSHPAPTFEQRTPDEPA